MLLTDSLVGAEGELEDRYLHNELDNVSDLTLAASSISIIQQSESSPKLQNDKDENVSSTTDESWMYPYPHFQVPTSSRYDKITREQLLSSKAHALGLLSSKNWIKSKKGSLVGNSDAPAPTRIRSSPGRMPKELHGNSNFVPTLEGVAENVRASNHGKMKVNSSKSVTDTIHYRLKTAGANVHGHTTPASQSRPIHTSQGSKPQQQRASSSTRHSQPQGRKQCITKPSHPKKQLIGIHRNDQLSSYNGQGKERLQGILKVKHENSNFIHDGMVAS